jgi:hypothetical protein
MLGDYDIDLCDNTLNTIEWIIGIMCLRILDVILRPAPVTRQSRSTQVDLLVLDTDAGRIVVVLCVSEVAVISTVK